MNNLTTATMSATIAPELKDLPHVPIDSLEPFQGDLKELSKREYAKLKKSLLDNGIIVPFFVWKETGKILDGHQRERVFINEGWFMDVPVIYISADNEQDAKKKLLVISSQYGRVTQDGWDDFTFDLDDEWIKQTVNFDALPLVFEDWDTSGDGGESKDAEPQISRADELQEIWQVKPGQLWRLPSRVEGQEHRIICGDCTDGDVVARVMGGEKAHVGVTSPPYNQRIDKFSPSGMQKENPAFVNRMAESYSDSMPEDDYQKSQIKLLDFWVDYFSDNGSMFYNHKIRYRNKQIVSPLTWILNTRWKVRQEIIWDRGSSITMNARMFIPADERIYWLRVGDDFTFNDTVEVKSWSSVWKVAAVNDVSISAAFATEIPTRAIMACSIIGDIVVDMHSGSGTTIIAAENLSRQCRAVEIHPPYVAVTLQRYLDAFGIEPELVTS